MKQTKRLQRILIIIAYVNYGATQSAHSATEAQAIDIKTTTTTSEKNNARLDENPKNLATNTAPTERQKERRRNRMRSPEEKQQPKKQGLYPEMLKKTEPANINNALLFAKNKVQSLLQPSR